MLARFFTVYLFSRDPLPGYDFRVADIPLTADSLASPPTTLTGTEKTSTGYVNISKSWYVNSGYA